MYSVQLLIKGRVQGVFFRAATKMMATELNITGWVKNTEDGHVLIIASGSEVNLPAFEKWCRIGPRQAAVTVVERTEIPTIYFEAFSILKD